MPIGAVRMTERHLKHDPPDAAEIAALTADIDQHLAPLTLPDAVPVIGTAGTATTLAAVRLELTSYDAAAVTGLRISPGGSPSCRAPARGDGRRAQGDRRHRASARRRHRRRHGDLCPRHRERIDAPMC